MILIVSSLDTLRALRTASAVKSPDLSPAAAPAYTSVATLSERQDRRVSRTSRTALSSAPKRAVAPALLAPASPLAILAAAIAAAQLLLAVLAITNYHVQIISRLSSAYPLWYWWMAGGLADGAGAESPTSRQWAPCIVVFMVMYAAVHAVSFSSFLPPA